MAVCARPVSLRVRQTLCLASVFFAIGAVGGMYLRGVAYEYKVEWSSTFEYSAETRVAIARTIFFPAALSLGDAFPNATNAHAMTAKTGVRADIWFHIYAISLLFHVAFPRALLALAFSRAARRSAARVELGA